jgi:hypothetical protein
MQADVSEFRSQFGPAWTNFASEIPASNMPRGYLMRSKIATLSVISTFLLLAACDYTTQTTSGRDWLAAHPPQTVDLTLGNIDQAVRDAAAVEPTLRFPARIGIARLDHARLTAIPPDEARAWTDAAGRLGGAYGEFVPVSPLVAAMVRPPHDSDVDPARVAIDDVRIAAARQHLDAVLIYETDATENTKDNPLSLAEWTLIGAFIVPTESVRAEGIAQAILLDVRNGYPYGTVQASADDTTATVRFGSGQTRMAMRDRVRVGAVLKLTTEAEAMMRKLQPELAALDKRKRAH